MVRLYTLLQGDKRQETKQNNDCDKSKQNKKISSREKANPSSTRPHKIKRCDENQERAAAKNASSEHLALCKMETKGKWFT